MRAIDVHAHWLPQAFWRAMNAGKDWYGARYQKDDQGREFMVVRGRGTGPQSEKMRWTTEERLKEMDALGVSMQVLSLVPTLNNYYLPQKEAVSAAREVNDEIVGLVRQWPARFSGLATLPLPYVKDSVAELERARQLGLKGAAVSTHINGRNWDEPEFAPIFGAAAEAGALLFFHPDQALVWQRINRYHLGNTIGNPLENSLLMAVLIFGGILDQHPNLKLVVAHGGGPTSFGIDRMDRGWQVRPEARLHIQKPPSTYLQRFHVDCITWGEIPLRFLIDRIGADRVVLGTDWPADMGLDSPVEWLSSLKSLTKKEKELLLHKNLERLLNFDGGKQ